MAARLFPPFASSEVEKPWMLFGAILDLFEMNEPSLWASGFSSSR